MKKAQAAGMMCIDDSNACFEVIAYGWYYNDGIYVDVKINDLKIKRIWQQDIKLLAIIKDTQ